MNNLTKNKTAPGILLTLIGGIFWGLSGACGQYLFQYKNATANWLVPIRLTVSGILLLIILFLKDRKKIFEVWRDVHSSILIILYGIFGMMLCQYTYFVTIQHSNAGIATVIQYLSPAIILIIVCIRSSRFPRASEMAALFLAILGTFILATHGDIHSFVLSKQALYWGLIAAVTCAFYTLQSSSLMKHFDAALIIGWGMLIGGILLLFLFKPWTQVVIVDFETILTLFTIIVFGTMISFTFYLTGVKLIGPSKASMIASIEPVSATVISVLWLNVSFTLMDFIGFICIMSTIFILSRSK